jgi:hypothetical protein
VDTTELRLTKLDDVIYMSFRKEFPDLKIDAIDLDAMKSTEGKAVSI